MRRRTDAEQRPATESSTNGETHPTPLPSEPHEESSALQCEGMLPLPLRIPPANGLHEGSLLHMTITDNGILIRGGRPSDSRRRWPRARKRLLTLQDDAQRQQLAEGNQIFYTLEEFFEALEQAAAEDADV